MNSKVVYACHQCSGQFLQYRSQVRGRAFCSAACYAESLRGSVPHNKGKRTVVSKPCKECGAPIEGCPSSVKRRTYCGMACTAKALSVGISVALKRYRVVGDCWLWEGSTRGGYGRMKLRSLGMVEAHRASYQYHVGQIPDGLVLDHICRNRACINPAHLEPVTTLENIRRGQQGSPEAMRKHWETRRKVNSNGTNRRNGAGGGG